MSSLSFQWDNAKAISNQSKHGVEFEEAVSAFLDERGRMIVDPDHSVLEDRFTLMGRSWVGRMLVVCFCHRLEGDVIRIISARPATRRESAQYRAE